MIQERQKRNEKTENSEFQLGQFGIRLTSPISRKEDGLIELSFELTEEWKKFYGLFRGISELKRSPGAFLKNNHQNKSFTLRYKADAINEIEAFMRTIFTALKKELQFKKELKKLISIKHQKDQETQLLFNDLP
jgi:hypothetical protein